MGEVEVLMNKGTLGQKMLGRGSERGAAGDTERYMMSRSEESPAVKLPKRWMFSHQSEEGHSRRKNQ